MSTKSIEKVLGIIGLALIVGLIFELLRQLNKKTETKVISDEGMKALHNPQKKKEIDEAIFSAKDNHQKTGVWTDPIIEF